MRESGVGARVRNESAVVFVDVGVHSGVEIGGSSLGA
jgi:hypothetical protein